MIMSSHAADPTTFTVSLLRAMLLGTKMHYDSIDGLGLVLSRRGGVWVRVSGGEWGSRHFMPLSRLGLQARSSLSPGVPQVPINPARLCAGLGHSSVSSNRCGGAVVVVVYCSCVSCFRSGLPQRSNSNFLLWRCSAPYNLPSPRH